MNKLFRITSKLYKLSSPALNKIQDLIYYLSSDVPFQIFLV